MTVDSWLLIAMFACSKGPLTCGSCDAIGFTRKGSPESLCDFSSRELLLFEPNRSAFLVSGFCSSDKPVQ